jgi:(2Fe-2S) ferredoxin
MPKFKKHIFVCMNQREAGHPRGCCDPAGLGELQRLFKTKLAQRGLTLVRANKSGCLDQCELGPTVAVYPEGIFYGDVHPEDLDEIIESHILNDRPVERLRIPDEVLNTTHQKKQNS